MGWIEPLCLDFHGPFNFTNIMHTKERRRKCGPEMAIVRVYLSTFSKSTKPYDINISQQVQRT